MKNWKNILWLIAIMYITQGICYAHKYAQNWMPIQAENGKFAEINIDKIERQDNIIRFYLKRDKEDGKIVVNRMETDLTKKQTAILTESIYVFDDNSRTGTKCISFKDYTQQKTYHPIKTGTLNETLYKFLNLSLDTPTLDYNIDWKKYFNKQQRRMQKHWHPNIMQCSHYPKERAIAYVTLIINKDGDIEYRNYKNLTNTASKYNDFNTRLKEEIDNVFYKVSKFEPLPKEYKGDKIVVIMKFEYSYKHDTKMEHITFNNVGFGFLAMGKNYSELGALGQLLIFPLKIPYYIFVEPFIN